MPNQYAFIAYDPDSSVYTIQPGATTSSIQSVINSAPPGAVLSFTAGTHTITDTLEIKRGDITLKGAGAGKTVFAFDMDSPGHGIFIDSSYKSWTGSLTQDAAEGATSIKLASTTGLKAGDVLHIQQANTDSFLEANGYENVVGTSYQDKLPINETLVEIASVSGNTVTLKTPMTHDMDASVTTIKPVNMLHDIKLSGFSVTYPSLGSTDPDNIANTESAYQGKIAIFINKTYGTEVTNVSVKDAPGHSMEFRTTLKPHVDGFTADGAHNKGDTGDGYGIQLSETYYGTFENLTLVNMRHAFVFSAWHTEVGNKVHILNTNRDINFHGGPDYDNVVLVDRALYREGDTTWRLVSPGGSKHPYTDINDNTVLFKVASSGSKYDVYYGSNDGAWMSGNVGKDTLYGGDSADILIGGAEDDTLIGGGGRDTFAMRSGDGRDDIQDFQTGANGDFLLLHGYSNVDSFSDLVFKQTSSGTRVTAAGQDVANLLGVDKDDLVAGNFSFSNSAAFTPPPVAPSSGGGGDTPDEPEEPPVIVDPDPPTTPEEPVAGIEKNLTSGVDNVKGTADADVVTTWFGQLDTDDTVSLGASADTLVIQNTGFTFDGRLYAKFSGIDVIDARASTGSGQIILDSAFMQRADSGNLTVRYGTDGLKLLDTRAVNGSLYKVALDGAGTVDLSSGGDSVAIGQNTKGAVNAGSGDDHLYFADDYLTSALKIAGGDGFDSLHFTKQANLTASDISGVSGVEYMGFTGTGNRLAIVSGMGGNVTLAGEKAGTEVLVDVTGATNGPVVTVGANINLSYTGSTSSTLVLQMSEMANGSITGSAGADRITGNSHDNTMNGGAGNDRLTGGGGRDTFIIGPGGGKDTVTDFQTGLSGDIVDLRGYGIGSLSQLKMALSGTGTLLTLSSTDGMFLENITPIKLIASNFIFNSSAPADPEPDPGTDPGTDPASGSGMTASMSKGTDKITGTADDDIVSAFKSHLSTADIVNLKDGHDTFRLLNTSASLDLRTAVNLLGIDEIDVTASAGSVKVLLGNALMAASDNGEMTIRYGSSGVVVDTGYIDHAKYDVFLQGTGAVTLGGRDDRIAMASGSKGNVHGGYGNDTLYGHDGMDFLYGDGGNDVISGGRGADTLSGGAGNDTFAYASALEGGDIITDFTSTDKLDLTELLAANGMGNLSASQALSGGYVKTAVSGNDVVVSFDKDGSGSQAAVTLATLKGAADDHITFATALIA